LRILLISNIPVVIVLASEYCRTRQTAQLLNLGQVKATRMIMNMRAADLVVGSNAVVD
jgi:phosphohistidine phosphatase SixA